MTQMSLCTNRNILRGMGNRLVVIKGERVWGRMEWEFGVSSCKLKGINPECSLEGWMLKVKLQH